MFPVSKERIIIIAGHYGCGKTNIAVNLALELAKKEMAVSIVDLDISKPFFRTTDSTVLFKKYNIDAILPEYANTNVEMPALPARFRSVFSNNSMAVIDVGGDDAGAVVLGGYKNEIKDSGYEMYFIYNKYRPSISNINDAFAMMNAIERVSNLKFTGIINNSNLGEETTAQDLIDTLPATKELSKISNVPTIALSALKNLEGNQQLKNIGIPILYIENITKKLF